MNTVQLIQLASDASGGGVSYTVSFVASGTFRGHIETRVFRWDDVKRVGVSYCDREYDLMKGTDMRDAYRPLAECVKVMRRDAEMLAPGYTASQLKQQSNGIASRKRIINFIRQYTEKNGCSPTRSEIAAGANVGLGMALDRFMKDMRACNLITYEDGKARTVKVNERAVREWLEDINRRTSK